MEIYQTFKTLELTETNVNPITYFFKRKEELILC